MYKNITKPASENDAVYIIDDKIEITIDYNDCGDNFIVFRERYMDSYLYIVDEDKLVWYFSRDKYYNDNSIGKDIDGYYIHVYKDELSEDKLRRVRKYKDDIRAIAKEVIPEVLLY